MPRASQTSASKGKQPANKTTKSTKGRSGRNVTVQELFAKQKSNQRKIPNDDEETDQSEEEDQARSSASEASSDESGSEVEESHTKRRRTDHTAEKRGSKIAKRQRRKGYASQPTEVSLSHVSQLLEQISLDRCDGIYDLLADPATDVDEVAADWVARYGKDNIEALRELVNFMIRSCGCMTAVTEDAFRKEDVAIEVLQELQEELAKLPQPEYPIISKSKTGRVLKKNILYFLETLLNQCQHEIIYDGAFIETLQCWLTTMSSSKYRPFRHTATIMAFKLLSSLCTFANKIDNELEITTRQLTTEERRGQRARNAEKKRLLEQRRRTLKRKQENLKEYLGEFFDSVFEHRAKDVESIIRTECMKELCNWMQLYPAYFVENQYLRHFGWAFNDQNASVRSDAIKSVNRLYKLEGIVEKLGTFTMRFRSRIEEMALYDIDTSARISALELCHTLYLHNRRLLSSSGRDELLELIVVDNDRIRKAAGPLAKTILEKENIQPAIEQAQATVANINKTWVALKCIATFLLEQTSANGQTSEDSENTNPLIATLEENNLDQDTDVMVTNAVDSLWSQVESLQDYESIAEYLSLDHSVTQRSEDSMEDSGLANCYRLTEAEESIIVKLLTASINLIITKGFDRENIKAKDRKKLNDESQLEENRNKISRYLIQVLPRLLTKYSDNTANVTKLVSIPQLMNLDVYAELRMQKMYEDLLETMKKIYLGATNSDLLNTCAKSLHHMSEARYLDEINGKQFAEIREETAAQMRDACRGKDLEATRLDADDIHSISSSMKRLECLINFINITDTMDQSDDMEEDIVELVGCILDRAAFAHENEKQMVLSAIAILFRYLAWKCERITVEANETEMGRMMSRVERRRDWMLTKFIPLVTTADLKPQPEVRSMAFGVLMDIYWIFSSNFFANEMLRISCPQDIQEKCKQYIENEINEWQNHLKERDSNMNEESEGDDEAEDQEDQTLSEKYVLLIANAARAINARVLDISHAPLVLSQYNGSHEEIDDIIKALVDELAKDSIGNDDNAQNICRVMLETLKQSFDAHVDKTYRSIDRTLSLARLFSQALYSADQEDPARHLPQDAFTARIHIDGITFVFSRAAEYQQQKDSAAKSVVLKFFRLLSVLVKPLTRARDVVKIRKHIDRLLQELKLTPEEGDKDWEGYHAYIRATDQMLKKKGVRYENAQKE